MNVKELIAALQTMPQDAEVLHLWDGEPRTGIDHVWLARNGKVITSEHYMKCYSTENRPLGAPDENEDPYWKFAGETYVCDCCGNEINEPEDHDYGCIAKL